MQTPTTDPNPPLPIFASEAYFELVEPKRIILSPLELCLVSDPDELFEDE